MSPDAIKAIFSPEADSDLIFLLTVYDPVTPTTVVGRVCDGFTKRISETADEVVYGVTSRSDDFVFLPMEISLPTEEEAQAPRCSIVMRDVTKYVIPLVRTIVGPPKVKMELVLSKTPDIVEASFTGFYISNFSYNADSVTADLSMIDYEREPFPMHAFTPAYFPGMF
jgi:hypothetical protein